MRKNEAKFTMRLPVEFKRWLAHQAIDNNRSLNSEILDRLLESKARQGGDFEKMDEKE